MKFCAHYTEETVASLLCSDCAAKLSELVEAAWAWKYSREDPDRNFDDVLRRRNRLLDTITALTPPDGAPTPEREP
jgi:hypothetical protein